MMILYSLRPEQQERMSVFTSRAFMTTSTVVITLNLVLVVDPAYFPDEIAEIRQFVESHLEEHQLYLLFTHSDWDHIAGFPLFPEAVIVASQAFLDNPDRTQQIDLLRDFDAHNQILRPYPLAYPSVGMAIREEREELSLGGNRLILFQAKGHTVDGLFALLDPPGLFLAGDYLSDIEIPYVFHSSAAYERTMLLASAILEEFPVRLLVPGHGHPTTDVGEMKRRVESSLRYLRSLREGVRRADEEAIERVLSETGFGSDFETAHRENAQRIEQELRSEAP